MPAPMPVTLPAQIKLPQRVRIVEVGARDGLQNEARTLSVASRVELIQLLGRAGLQTIEAGSFTSAKWVPQMAESGEVLKSLYKFKHLGQSAGIDYPMLVPNFRGLEDAVAAGAQEIAVFAAASETFSRKNINRGIDESLDQFARVVPDALSRGMKVRGYVSCVLGCPYEGAVSVAEVVRVAGALYDLGCYEVSLGDTIGIGTPGKAAALIDAVATKIPVKNLAAHFHDTYGQALANIYAVLQRGVEVVDSSVAGLGGCPYAKGASGNVATEDVVYMLDGLGIHSGVDLDAVVAVGNYICAQLGRNNHSKVAMARSSVHPP